MTAPRPADERRRFAAPDPIPKLLRELIHERTGLYFESDRFDLMLEKLEPRLEAHRLTSYLDYYYLLKYDSGGSEEWRRLLDAYSVQETYFWRESDQIRALVDHIVPQWFQRTHEPLRVWSSACATGEEPYSIAMALEEGGWGSHPIEITGSDASEAALAKARAATYRERSFRMLPAALRARYFKPGPEGEVLRPDIASRVRFRWHNLVNADDYSQMGQLNVIFCRNVFIYFSPQAITRVTSLFARHLPPHGHLFIGASESLLKLTTLFDLREIAGAFVYARREKEKATA